MKTEEEKNWDELIKKNLLLDETSIDFTNKVMQRIEELDVIKEKAMGNLFKKYAQEEPSPIFSEKIMAQLSTKPGFVYQPVISKRAWFVLGLIAIAIFVVVLKGSSPEELNNPVYSNLVLKFSRLIDIKLPAIFSSKLLAVSLAACSILMSLEYFFRSRQSV
ncbi:MAG: hypothetical protein U5K51_10110 [Flavobacteriaceae bacterium]|nr:hypothetical protein [Flavobacteriaceae bacterium]